MSKPARYLVSTLALSVGVAACGGAAPPESARSAQEHSVQEHGVQEHGASPSSVRRRASDAVKKAFPTQEVDVVVYVDAAGLLKTTLVNALVRGLLPIVAGSHTAEKKACLDDTVWGLRELVLASVKGGGDLIVVQLAPAAATKVGACLGELVEAQPGTVEGAVGAWRKGNDVLAVNAAGLLVYGPPGLVEAALAGRGDGKALEALSLERDEYVAWSANVGEGAPPMRGSILVSDDRVLVSAEGDAPDEALAERVERTKDDLAASLLRETVSPQQSEVVMRLIAGATLERDGRHLTGRFELRGSAQEMVADIGVGAVMAVRSVRRYIVRAKQAEAKNVLAALGRALAEDWEAAGPAAAKKKLVSFPPTPKTVPRGAKSEGDWKPWARLKFEMTAPQYYQYEIKASKDGKSADIIARGDLDGDGVASELKLTVTVTRDGRLEIAPVVAETNPDE